MTRFYKNLIILGVFMTLGILLANNILKKDIIILDNHQSYHISTLKKDMGVLFATHQIELSPTDKVVPSLDTVLEEGMEIQIIRSFPVEIAIGDTVQEHYTTLLKVGDILKEAGIVLEPMDKVYPSEEEKIKGDRKIELVKVEKTLIEQNIPVGYAVIVQRSNQLKSGMGKEQSVGAFGAATETLEVIKENGQEVSRSIVEWAYDEMPVEGKLLKGKEKFLVLADGTPYRYKKVLNMVASAYDLSFASCGKYPDHPQYGITYSGTKARPGVVAVDPKTIKLRSNLYVESLDRMPDYGFSQAEDTGSAIKSNRIDLFISNNAQAMRYGRRKVRVYVLEDEFDADLMVGYSR